MNIKDNRTSMLESDTPVMLKIGVVKNAPNYYRVLSDKFTEELHPLNKRGDYLTATGWNGVLPVKPLRDWLKVTDPCIMEISITPEDIHILADNTMAIFKITGINDFVPGKNILALIPLDLEQPRHTTGINQIDKKEPPQ